MVRCAGQRFGGDLEKSHDPPEGLAATGALRDRVKIELLRVVRHPLPALVPQEHGRPGDTAAGQFSVFLNGVARFFIPPQGLALPVTGGSASINVCMTVDVTGLERSD